jgi:hypothetical protein
MSVNGAEMVAGALLVFFVPGYAVTKAVFPEWRIRGAVATLRLLEVVTLSLVTSVGLTVLVGYALLEGGPNGFQAAWGDPLLEAVLAAVAAVAFVVAWERGAFARTPPAPPAPEPADEAGTWRLVEQLDELRREERRIRHRLRQAPAGSTEASRLRGELERVRAETSHLQTRREEEYAG